MEIFGLSIKAKVSGSYVSTTPSVKISGTWTKVKKVSAKKSGSWGTPLYEYESVYTLSAATHTDVDLDALSLDRYHDVRVVIPSGATLVASSTSTYALKTGTSHVAKLTIQNAGTIVGRGGAGGRGGLSGSGGHAGPAGGSGSAGGASMHIESNVTILNTGTIAGGGGGSGGGGSGGGDSNWSNYYAGGGGGGGGAPYGAGGAQGSGSEGRTGSAGSAASLTSAGAGGAGSCHSEGCGSAGATGGAYGTNGSGASSGTGQFASAGGSAGAAGATYYNPSTFTIATS